MRFGRPHLYATLAVAAAVAYGIGVGPYWLTDMVVFAVVAGVVAFLCFAMRAKTESIYTMLRMGTTVGRQYAREPDQREHVHDPLERVPRSRIAHYVTVSRTKSKGLTAWLGRESESPFERALLSNPRWRTLSGESLEEISKEIPDVSTKSA